MTWKNFITENIEIKGVRVYGLDESIIASGYPMVVGETTVDKIPSIQDNKRIRALGKCEIGAGHDNALNGIIVQFDLTVPVKVWTELQRYHFIDFVSSQSTVWRLSKMDYDSCFDVHTDKRIIEIMKELRDKYAKTQSKEDYLTLLMSCPTGVRLTARMTTNYRQLKTQWVQRHNHTLPHWRDYCRWIETLELMPIILEKYKEG